MPPATEAKLDGPSSHRESLESLRDSIQPLVESIDTLIAQINYGGGQGLISWPDLVTRYSLLLSYCYSISNQLIPPPQPSTSAAIDEDVVKVEEKAWAKTLARVVAFPQQAVAPDKQFLLGALLRTRLMPEIESNNTKLINTLPKSLAIPEAPQAVPETLPALLSTTISEHDALIKFALKRLRNISNLDNENDEDEDSFAEFGNDSEFENFYDWRMRVELDDLKALGDLSSESSEMELLEKSEAMETELDAANVKGLSLRELASLMREGKIVPQRI